MIKHCLNQSEMKKYIELGTLDVKIGPFSRILGLETSILRFKIYAIVIFWASNLIISHFLCSYMIKHRLNLKNKKNTLN